ncbi:MAG: asparagine synthetase B, partial [Oscillospiraceae bacterium]|nr:asparagine synthetase B [Oscillospiraceae bacterium]
MCSIMGFTSGVPSPEAFMPFFERTKSRGPDMSRVEKAGNGYLCFHRLAIMGLHEEGMQPFHLKGDMCVCNGELYLFRPLKKELEDEGYVFQSDSDCEIILPLYHKYGVEMFGKLDAEFAMILYDAETDSFIAARDPIGIRPLFYGTLADGSMVFASEAKNLVGLCGEIKPFPPGHYWKDGVFTRYADFTTVDSTITGDLDEICAGIREKLILGVDKRLDADAPLGFLLSGGLDSSLVCAISAKILGKHVRTFAIGM